MDSFLTSNLVDTFVKNHGIKGVFSVWPILLMLVNLAVYIIIIYAAVRLDMAANIYIRKNK